MPAAVELGVCCCIPLLLAAGAIVTIAGLGIGRWVVIVVGLSIAVFAIAGNGVDTKKSSSARGGRRRTDSRRGCLGVVTDPG